LRSVVRNLTGTLGTENKQRFNDTLHHGDKKRIQLGTESVSEIKEVKKLFETAQNAKLQHDEGRKGYSGYPRKILKEIHKYAQVVDVFIQQQPEITAVIWGSIRFLIQVLLKNLIVLTRSHCSHAGVGSR
jgi:hypothetical protein